MVPLVGEEAGGEDGGTFKMKKWFGVHFDLWSSIISVCSSVVIQNCLGEPKETVCFG